MILVRWSLLNPCLPIAKEQRVLVVTAVAQLAEGLHDGLVPRDGGLKDVEGHGHLGRGLGLPDAFPPQDEAFGENLLFVVAFPVLVVGVVVVVAAVLAAVVLDDVGLGVAGSSRAGPKIKRSILRSCFLINR